MCAFTTNTNFSLNNYILKTKQKQKRIIHLCFGNKPKSSLTGEVGFPNIERDLPWRLKEVFQWISVNTLNIDDLTIFETNQHAA